MTYTPREKFTTMWENAWDFVRTEVFAKQVKEDLEDIQSEMQITTLVLPTVNLTASRMFAGINAGATITAGQLCVLGTAGKWILADSNDSTTYLGMCVIALESKTDGQAMNVALPGSFVRYDTWAWTTNDMAKKFLFMGETAGAMVDTAPVTADANNEIMACVITATVIWFQPGMAYAVHV